MSFRSRRSLTDTRGLSSVEYVVVLVLIAIVSLMAWRTFGGVVTDRAELSGERIATMEGAGSAAGTPSGYAGLISHYASRPSHTDVPGGLTRTSAELRSEGIRPRVPTQKGLAREAEEAIRQEPDLQRLVRRLESENIAIVRRDPRDYPPIREGSIYDPVAKEIVIPSNWSPARQLHALVHEAYHADPSQVALPDSPMVAMQQNGNDRAKARAQYIKDSVDAEMVNEGGARLAQLAFAADRTRTMEVHNGVGAPGVPQTGRPIGHVTHRITPLHEQAAEDIVREFSQPIPGTQKTIYSESQKVVLSREPFEQEMRIGRLVMQADPRYRESIEREAAQIFDRAVPPRR